MVAQKFEKEVILSEKKILRGRINNYVPIRQLSAFIFINLGIKNKESAQTPKNLELWFLIFPFSCLTLHPRF